MADFNELSKKLRMSKLTLITWPAEFIYGIYEAGEKTGWLKLY